MRQPLFLSLRWLVGGILLGNLDYRSSLRDLIEHRCGAMAYPWQSDAAGMAALRDARIEERIHGKDVFKRGTSKASRRRDATLLLLGVTTSNDAHSNLVSPIRNLMQMLSTKERNRSSSPVSRDISTTSGAKISSLWLAGSLFSRSKRESRANSENASTPTSASSLPTPTPESPTAHRRYLCNWSRILQFQNSYKTINDKDSSLQEMSKDDVFDNVTILHRVISQPEEVKVPVLTASQAWKVMGRRFKEAHRNDAILLSPATAWTGQETTRRRSDMPRPKDKEAPYRTPSDAKPDTSRCRSAALKPLPWMLPLQNGPLPMCKSATLRPSTTKVGHGANRRVHSGF